MLNKPKYTLAPKRRVNKMSTELAKEHYEIILILENGADILGYSQAKLLREVEKIQPKFIKICKPKYKYRSTQKIPYFGAVATKAGLAAAREKLNIGSITITTKD